MLLLVLSHRTRCYIEFTLNVVQMYVLCLTKTIPRNKETIPIHHVWTDSNEPFKFSAGLFLH